MSLLSIGTVAFDTVETPFGRAEQITGGAAYYTSWAASFFTNKIGVCSIVGADYPQAELDAMNARGIDTKGIEIKQDGKTFFWEGKYHTDMNQRDTIATDLNVLDDFNPILPDSYKSLDYVMLGNLTPEIQMQVVNQMADRPKLIALDTMNFWMDIALEPLKAVIAKIDLLTINDEEARQLSGEYSLVKAAEKILAMGPRYLVVKKGEHGALLFGEDNVFFAPALPLAEVKDPTGAGDTFAGGMMGYIAQQDDTSWATLKKSIIYGSAMASFCVEDFSIKRVRTLTMDEINARVEMFGELVAF